MTHMTLSEELQWRGFVNQTTFKQVQDVDSQKRTFYWGVDPSAPSMTIGNLAAAMMVRIFIKHGYTPILLVGGATGLIGDPDGKAKERDLKTLDEVNSYKKSIISQYKQIFDGLDFKTVDNLDWFKDINYLDFLREVGKHVPMRQMLARDFVQSRLGEDGTGISYAEFSYSLIQGYDFLHLFKKYGATLQISGADQWGNCITGVDLIRRKTGEEAHIWTTPLIINQATGRKFGKSEEGAVWLDPGMTSPFKFYQFWLNIDDEGCEDYLKVYTTLDKQKINQTVKEFEANPAQRAAQKLLAYEVTKLVHGKEVADLQIKLANSLFNIREFNGFSASEFRLLEQELPFVEVSEGIDYIDVLAMLGLASSKSDARRLIEQGAVNSCGLFDVELGRKIKREDSLGGYVIVFRGKKHIGLVKIK